MKVLIQKCLDVDDKVIFIIFMNDKGEIVYKIPIYASKELDSELPGIMDGADMLCGLLESIYLSGLNNEHIEFSESVKDFKNS